jgi:hypothetical protein
MYYQVHEENCEDSGRHNTHFVTIKGGRAIAQAVSLVFLQTKHKGQVHSSVKWTVIMF